MMRRGRNGSHHNTRRNSAVTTPPAALAEEDWESALRVLPSQSDMEAAVRVWAQRGLWRCLEPVLGKWGLSLPSELMVELLLACLQAIDPSQEEWPNVLPGWDRVVRQRLLPKLCRDILSSRVDLGRIYDAVLSTNVSLDALSMLDVCVSPNTALGLVLSVLSVSDKHVHETIPFLLDKPRFCPVMLLSFAYEDWEFSHSCFGCLRDVEHNSPRTINRKMLYFVPENLSTQMREKGKLELATCLDAWSNRWNRALSYFGQADDVVADDSDATGAEAIDFALFAAAVHNQWEILLYLLPRYWQDQELLTLACGTAFRLRDSYECFEDVLSRVRPLSPQLCACLLNIAAHLSCERGEVAPELKRCIEAGISTQAALSEEVEFYNRMWSMTTKNAVHLPVVKLLYDSGACSNTELDHCRMNGRDLIKRLRENENGDVADFVESIVSAP